MCRTIQKWQVWWVFSMQKRLADRKTNINKSIGQQLRVVGSISEEGKAQDPILHPQTLNGTARLDWKLKNGHICKDHPPTST
jgi:hypothetical protein